MMEAKAIFDIFEAAGHDIFLVGGFVRDKILGIASNDIDFATSAKPRETMAVLESAGLPVIPIGEAFGTIQTILDDEKVEITTFRCKESYTKGSRKPSVEFGSTIEEDLVRRDFTFNAMAMRSDGSLVDPFGGQSDLEHGIVRVPGNPVETFTDDPLRILRAARFMSKVFADCIDADTLEGMRSCASLTSELSAERVFEEMTKLLTSLNPAAGLRILVDSGVMGVLFPELLQVVEDERPQGKWHHLSVWEHTLEVVSQSSERIPEVRWAALFHDVAKPMCRSVDSKGDVHFFKHDAKGAEIWESVARRLKTSREFREHVSQLIFEHQNGRRPMGNKAVRRLVHRLGVRLDNLFELERADILAHHPKFEESSLADLNAIIRATREVGSVSDKLPTGTGDVVAKALGIKPGPELGVIIKKLQKQLVEGTLTLESDFVKAARGLQQPKR
jgi:putative nucleotidyltransferase with HDIG domain